MYAKLITVNRLIFSYWPLFNAEALFSFFEMSFDIFVVFFVFKIVCSAGVSCACFVFLFLVVH